MLDRRDLFVVNPRTSAMTEPAHASPQPLAEPKTPMWLPALGAALFFTVGLVWAATPPPPVPVAEVAADAGVDAPEDARSAAPEAAAPAYVSVPAVQASASASSAPAKTRPPKAPHVRTRFPPNGTH